MTEEMGRKGCAGRGRLAVMVFLFCIAVGLVVIFGFRGGTEHMLDVLAVAGAGLGVMLLLFIALGIYYSLYWRWKLRPGKELLEKAVEMYKTGNTGEALAACEGVARDRHQPPLARILACANCYSFTTEMGRGDDASKWREAAFEIDAKRAKNIFGLMDDLKEEDCDDACELHEH